MRQLQRPSGNLCAWSLKATHYLPLTCCHPVRLPSTLRHDMFLLGPRRLIMENEITAKWNCCTLMEMHPQVRISWSPWTTIRSCHVTYKVGVNMDNPLSFSTGSVMQVSPLQYYEKAVVLSTKATRMLVQSLDILILDYCKSRFRLVCLLCGIKPLQRIPPLISCSFFSVSKKVLGSYLPGPFLCKLACFLCSCVGFLQMVWFSPRVQTHAD